MSLLKKATMLGAAGTASSAASGGLYVEDVFSTYLYDGTGAAQTITNGIDLDGEGGLVWLKARTDGNEEHNLYDTERGATKRLISHSTLAESTELQAVTSFNSNGFSVGTANMANKSANNFVSWTFRKAPKFFDIVTYTGNGTAGRTVSHNLGSVPGCIIIKSTTLGAGWNVYHRGNGANPETKRLLLNSTSAAQTLNYFGDTVPTDSVFSLGSDAQTNGSGNTYVAYLFAHNDGDGEFGESGDQDIIKCGSFIEPNISTGGSVEVDLGWEPQWILMKNAGQSVSWSVYDVARGNPVTNGATNILKPDSSAAEITSAGPKITQTGFKIVDEALFNFFGGSTVIYIAIRRPMKTPTSGSEVFNPKLVTLTGTTTSFDVGFSPDLIINGVRSNANFGQNVVDRLRGVTRQLYTPYTSVEGSLNGTALVSFDMDGFTLGADTQITGWNTGVGWTTVKWCYKRATGFFDVVAYTGNGTAGHTVNHNLGVAPEMIWVKKRDSANDWPVYTSYLGNTSSLLLNESYNADTSNTVWNNTTPTDTQFYLGNNPRGNASGGTYIAYLFATLDGISKVGSYTGNGTSQNINCGFSAGARFVLIKRTDATGDWYVWDTSRGIVTGNDPFLALNSAAVENSSYDSVDPYSAGFSVNQDAGTNINVSSGTYIFLAIS